MARMTNSIRPSVQFAAILKARWLMFIHSIRTDEGKMELVGRILFGLLGVTIGFGGSFGMGTWSYFLTANKHLEFLAIPLWLVMLFWQFFPVIGTTFAGNLDSKNLTRFPLTYRSFYFIQLMEGLIGPTAAVPCLWLLGITIGISIAKPSLLAPVVVIVGAFGAMNLLLSRTIMTWVDRWMQQRRTREIFALVFFLLMMCTQFIGPLFQRMAHHQQQLSLFARAVASAQKPLPPGAASLAIEGVASGDFGQTAIYLGLLVAYSAIFVKVLGIRLRAQYRGENLSEIERKRDEKLGRKITPGWNVLGLPGPISAVFQKEIRYISRSGQMILALVSPVLVLFVFRFNSAATPHGNPIFHAAAMAFPLGSVLALLSVSNMFSNAFGGEGAGMQLLYAAPVSFRQIMLGKNLAYASLFCIELVIIWTTLTFMNLTPSPALLISTVLALIFALATEATLGNLLSLFLPKKLDYGKFMNRQQTSALAGLANMSVTAIVIGVSAGAFYLSSRAGTFFLGFGILAALAAMAVLLYRTVLGQVDGIAAAQREKLIAEVSKTS